MEFVRRRNGEAPRSFQAFVPQQFTLRDGAQAFGEGFSDAAVVMANEFTFNQIDSLDELAKQKIKDDPNLLVAQVGAIVARECLTTVVTGGAASVVLRGGRVAGVLVTKVAPKVAQVVGKAAASCAVQTVGNVAN